MSEATGHKPVALPSFRIGPENMGRGYSLLSTSKDLDTGAWRADLAMMMLNWAKKREQRAFAACFDLGDGAALVFRARYFRDTDIGVIAYANGVYCSKQALSALHYRTALILNAIPQVEEDQHFGADAVKLAYTPLPQAIINSADAWAPFGMGWQPTFLKTPSDIHSDEVIMQALASVRPQILLTRNLGWVTSAALESRGKLAPYSRCRLVVGYDDAPPSLPERFAKLSVRPDGALEGAIPKTPQSLLIWDQMTAIIDAALEGSKKAKETAATIISETNHHIDPLFHDTKILASQMALIASNNIGFSKVAHMLAMMRASNNAVLYSAADTVQERYLTSVIAAGKTEKFLRGVIDRHAIHPASTADLLPQLNDDAIAQISAETASAYLAQLVGSDHKKENMANPLYRRNILGLIVHLQNLGMINGLHHDVLNKIISIWPNDSLSEWAGIVGQDIIDIANTGGGNQVCILSKRLFGPPIRQKIVTQSAARATLVKNLSAQLYMHKVLRLRSS